MSEFGKGFAYCLGLFIAHEERASEYRKNEKDIAKTSEINMAFPSMWFNGAADHLFDLEIPEMFNEEKKQEIKDFKSKCLNARIDCDNDITWDDVSSAIGQAKDLLLELDKVIGIECEKGDYE